MSDEEYPRYKLEPEDIEWQSEWGDKEVVFEKEKAVALLLINDVIFLNTNHWEKDWPEEARKATAILVNCNDIFAWGCADAERISFYDIKKLYDLWKQYPVWGPALWCMIQRREMPQDPVAESMRGHGIDLDAFQKEHNLRVNFYSGCSLYIARFKYQCYSEWATANGMEVRPFDAGWWEGWREFEKAHPNWWKEVGDAASDRLREQFKQENGWEEAE
jgi:hypothetical protein